MTVLPSDLQSRYYIRAHTATQTFILSPQHFSSFFLDSVTAIAKEMEAKNRAAAIAVVCMLLMFSGQQQQVAAMSEFCACYQQCYPGCRQKLKLPPWACVLFCIELQCRPIPDGVPKCRAACGLDNLCGLSTGRQGKTKDNLTYYLCIYFLRWTMLKLMFLFPVNTDERRVTFLFDLMFLFSHCRWCHGLYEQLQREAKPLLVTPKICIILQRNDRDNFPIIGYYKPYYNVQQLWL